MSERRDDEHPSRRRSRSRSPDDRYHSRSRSPDDRSRDRSTGVRRRRFDPRSLSPSFSARHYWKDSSNGNHRPPREALYVRKVVPLGQYSYDFRSGKFAQLSYRKKMEMFGSGIMPIFVPLAPGESEHQYETRFRAWVRRQGRTLQELQQDSNIYTERMYRIDFANANVAGTERFESFDWSKHTVEESKQDEDVARSDDPKKAGEKDKTAISSSTEKRRDETGTAAKETPEKQRMEAKPVATPAKTSSANSKPANDSSQSSNVAAPPVRSRVCPSKQPEILQEKAHDEITELFLSCGCTPCLFVVMERTAHQLHDIQTTTAIQQSTT